MASQKRKIAIIGLGPRGGYACERFMVALARKNHLTNIHISLFEQTGDFGNGQVYDVHQNASNWINITERVLNLNEREPIETDSLNIESFPSYKEWASKDYSIISEESPDTYPPRSKIGKFLSQRLQSLLTPLVQSGIASLHQECVQEVQWLDDGKLVINTHKTTHKDFDEILLTIGHQPTKLSKQIQDWEKFVSAKKDIYLFKSPYPISSFLQHKSLEENSTIGIRGFGLAMIDVTRAIANKFGEFVTTNEKTKACEFETERPLKNLLVPFSLDGLPPVPKPLNAHIDNWFTPSQKSLTAFEEQIGDKENQKAAKSPQFLIDAFAPIASTIYSNLPNTQNTFSKKEIEQAIDLWLKDQTYEHPLFLSTKQSAEQSMQDYVGMAIGEKSISLDFCIGQVWRHCQPSIYKALSFNECSNKVFAEIIKLDESTKRYSYGPPVESIQQLIALSNSGVLNLDFVCDPTIDLIDEGWQFTDDKKTITVNLMIDSVLDSPKIRAVRSTLIQNLLSDNLMQAVHDDFGVVTDENGYLVSDDINRKIPIALLGRLAKGTIIGVDAILECFGTRPRQWAIQAAKNHEVFLNQNSN
ncbi:FAD/NAD(P)-binding protein [Tenacibaculum tangerinum]|uniref:FAD/NAD(P)-binding protein n=1 Tax=Tenacibaculum tangerinum TaxID=3038772 RepID=A0ABY8L5N0_9FLAO|nr:FAD/NAD(P)-binding protein [Tenacibaculum tangerinum]WGH76718.1 FAD/NAD(P)-binding protein [Tenacibaculum tangerinum]